jgi:hypothetical protein
LSQLNVAFNSSNGYGLHLRWICALKEYRLVEPTAADLAVDAQQKVATFNHCAVRRHLHA